MGKKRQSEFNNKNESKCKRVKSNFDSVRSSEENIQCNNKWLNKERVLIFASRGIGYRDRHLMKDINNLMPHSKSETKMDKKDNLNVINELCEMKNCSKCLYFESRRKQDLFLWMSNCHNGPSVRFSVENVHTMMELKLTGNCLMHSRPILCFNKKFDDTPYWRLIKELIIQIFSTPQNHPKSQPFVDHVLCFAITDKKIWLRNYQTFEEDGKLAEIGPRMVLNPIKIFSGSFEGKVLWQNPHYVSQIHLRRQLKLAKANKYIGKINQKESKVERSIGSISYKSDIKDELFSTKVN